MFVVKEEKTSAMLHLNNCYIKNTSLICIKIIDLLN